MTIARYSSKHMLILPAVFLAVFALISLLSRALPLVPDESANALLLFLSIPGHLAMIAYVALVLGTWKRVGREFNLLFRWKDTFLGILFGLSILAITSVLSILLPRAAPSAHTFVFNRIDAVFILYVIFAGIAAPVIEEIVFRGFLWRILEEKKIARGLILPATSLLFAAMHMDLARFPVLFAGGLFYGIMRWKTGSVNLSVAAHITNNLAISAITLIIPLILRS